MMPSVLKGHGSAPAEEAVPGPSVFPSSGTGVSGNFCTGEEWRNNSRKNEGMEPKQKQYPAVDVTGDRIKSRCCKEQYCHARGEGERVLALESREGTRASRRVEEGLSRSLSGGGGRQTQRSPEGPRHLHRIPRLSEAPWEVP